MSATNGSWPHGSTWRFASSRRRVPVADAGATRPTASGSVVIIPATPRRRAGRLVVVPTRMHDGEVEMDDALVRRLLAAQMPDLADRPLTIVEPWGTDNGIWRLGDDLVVRLPRIGWATSQIER